MSDDEGEAFPSVPSPRSPGRAEDGSLMEDGEGHGDVSKLAEVPAAKRKGVKRPQPKLDSQRLVSERGLPALRTLFDSVRFKGRGHEAEDLRLLMQKMENWAHRLFPKLQFEEFVDKVERLGKKKDVQTCLKRIRLDMPLVHEAEASQDVEEEIAPESHIFGSPDAVRGSSFSEDLPGLTHSTPAPPAAPAASLTEEQHRRMELNRQRALQKKLARQQQQEQQEQEEEQQQQQQEEEPPAGGSDSQPAADELASVTSEDPEESDHPSRQVKDLNLEPSSQPPHAQAAPSASGGEEEEESSARPAQRPSSCGED